MTMTTTQPKPYTPAALQTESLRAAADALRAGSLIDQLAATSDDELRRIVVQLEAAQRCLRAILRERARLAQRDADWRAREEAAGLAPHANGSAEASEADAATTTTSTEPQ